MWYVIFVEKVYTYSVNNDISCNRLSDFFFLIQTQKLQARYRNTTAGTALKVRIWTTLIVTAINTRLNAADHDVADGIS